MQRRINMPNICGHKLFIELFEEYQNKLKISPHSENPNCKDCRNIIEKFTHMLKYKTKNAGKNFERI